MTRFLSINLLALLVATLPSKCFAALPPLAALAASVHHTCGITNEGSVMCWGRNEEGQVGAERNAPFILPNQVAGLPGTIVSVGVGARHSCALSASGSVFCWGSNANGELGSDTIISTSSPIKIDKLPGRIVAISASLSGFNCALSVAGEVFCWGRNVSGSLGAGVLDAFSANPKRVLGLDGGAIAITSGGSHSCALTPSGGVKCWGSNTMGQLGSDTEESAVTSVIGLPERAISINAGYQHTCAITVSRKVYCWGSNLQGELGYRTITSPISLPTAYSSRVPVLVGNLEGDAKELALGANFSCALGDRGGVKCWGYGANGRLGNGSVENLYQVQDVVNMQSGCLTLAAGFHHACVVQNTGKVFCWGQNAFGELGVWSTTQSLVPLEVVQSEVPNTGPNPTRTPIFNNPSAPLTPTPTASAAPTPSPQGAPRVSTRVIAGVAGTLISLTYGVSDSGGFTKDVVSVLKGERIVFRVSSGFTKIPASKRRTVVFNSAGRAAGNYRLCVTVTNKADKSARSCSRLVLR